MVPSFSQSFRVTLASFVLGNLVLSVSFASVVLAECSSDFGNVDHLDYCNVYWLSIAHFLVYVYSQRWLKYAQFEDQLNIKTTIHAQSSAFKKAQLQLTAQQ